MRYKFTDLYIKHYCAKQANAVTTPYNYKYTAPEMEEPPATWGDAATEIGWQAAIPGALSLSGGAWDSLKHKQNFFKSTGRHMLNNVGFDIAPPNPKLSRFGRFARIGPVQQAALGSLVGAYTAFSDAHKTSQLEGQGFMDHMNQMSNNWELLDSWKRVGQSRNTPEYVMNTLGAVLGTPFEAGQLAATFNQRLQARNISKSLANHEVDGFVDNGRWGDLFFGLFGNKKTTSGYRDFARQAQANGLKGSEHYYNRLTNAHDKGTQLDSNELSELEDHKFYYDSVARNKMNPSMTFDKFRQFRAYKRNTGSRLTQQEFLSGNISADTHNTDQKNRLDKEYAKLEAQRTA